jgi:alanine racemase
MLTEGREHFTMTPASSVDWGGRGTRAEIDLDALAANIDSLRKLAPKSMLLTVVKANAYGHGAVEVAKTAIQHGAAWLGVYTVDEGAALRKAGIESRILVFGPFRPPEARTILRFDLTPTLYSVEAGEWLQAAGPMSPVSYHFKIDTGLTRGGVAVSDALGVLTRLGELPALKHEGIFTHFARADEPNTGETEKQFGLFVHACNDLAEAGFHFSIRHAANSAAVLTAPQTHLDMIRCGISVYGYAPSPEVSSPAELRPVMSVYSYIAKLQTVAPGTGVGYGHTFHSKKPTRIGLIPIGYADGISRTLGSGVGQVIVGGKLVPIVGRISMDQATVDVTSVPEARIGDAVTVIGRHGELRQSADEIARALGTINYEVLASIMPRVPRLFMRGGRIVGKQQLLSQT